MADGLDIRVNLKELQKTLDALQASGKAVGLTTQHLVWEVAADAAKDAIKYTAPREEGGFKGTKGSKNWRGWALQKKIGEKAITGDLGGLFADMTNAEYVFFENKGKIYGRHGRSVFEIAKDHYNISGHDIETVHLANRGRGGRVPSRTHQYWANGKKVKKYVKGVMKKVGELKAGWYPGVKKFCALIHKSEGIPKWISSKTPEGYATDSMKADGNGKIIIENTSHHREAIRSDLVFWIQKKRQNDVEQFLPKRLEKIAERFNKGQAKAEAVTA